MGPNQAAGRLLSENYSPCETHHAPYDAAPEVTYEYDDPALDAADAFSSPSSPHFVGVQDCRSMSFNRGRLVVVTDRAQRSVTCFDGRGRTVEVAKQLAQPAHPDGVIDGRWYRRRATYDGADRPVTDSTGATTNQPSTVTTTYTRRGAVDQVGSSYGLLVSHVKRDADGLVQEIQYGDAAATTTAMSYDDLRRLRNLTTYRASIGGWSNADGTQQMLLQDEQFTYDRVGNPLEIRDWRDPTEWPAGAKPVTRKMTYDSLCRLSRMDYQYSTGDDAWVDPYAAEVLDNERPQPSLRADFSAGGKRVQWQSYRYDWLGNTEVTDDDAHAFYDRSLGTVSNDGYKLSSASNQPSSPRHGSLNATYDAAGHLQTLALSRNGPCVPSGKCEQQRFEYEWDEVGRLVRARRWDTQNPDAVPPDAELVFTYDASDQRVRKTSGTRHTVYVFSSLELRGAELVAGDYALTSETEVPFLFANGVRLARVANGDATRVYLELGDHLGSTSVVLDRATGELVQRDTAYAYGAAESSYRTEKFDEFREDYRFTGKEDDVEVGLIYFGKRYYAPLLQRWISADPLAVHAPGEADLNLYAYVRGRVLVAVDPVGLLSASAQPARSMPKANERAIMRKAVTAALKLGCEVPSELKNRTDAKSTTNNTGRAILVLWKHGANSEASEAAVGGSRHRLYELSIGTEGTNTPSAQEEVRKLAGRTLHEMIHAEIMWERHLQSLGGRPSQASRLYQDYVAYDHDVTRRSDWRAVDEGAAYLSKRAFGNFERAASMREKLVNEAFTQQKQAEGLGTETSLPQHLSNELEGFLRNNGVRMTTDLKAMVNQVATSSASVLNGTVPRAQAAPAGGTQPSESSGSSKVEAVE